MARNQTVSFVPTASAVPAPAAGSSLALALRSPQYRFGAETLRDATSTDEPVQSIGYGLTKLARALVGGYFMNQGQEREVAADRTQRQQAAAMFGGPSPLAQSISTAQPPTQVAAAPGASPAATAPAGASPVMGGAPQPAAGASPVSGMSATQLQTMAIQAASSDNPHIQAQAPLLMQMATTAATRENRQQHAPMAIGPNQRVFDPNTGRWLSGPPGGGGGAGAAGGAPFGAGESSRAYGVITNPQSDPNSEIYAAAWNIVAHGTPITVPNTEPGAPPGSLVQRIILPDMTRFRQPGGGRAAAGGAAPAQPQAPPVDPRGFVAGATGAPPAMPTSTVPGAALGAPPQAAGAPAAASRVPGLPTVTTLPGSERTAAPTTDQSRTGSFAVRMGEAEQILQRLERGGYDPTNLTDAIGARGGIPGNYAMSEQGQQYRQAQENWVRANLRRESGAVIGADEMTSEVRNYFPQPGDSRAVITQKAQNRRLVQQGLAREAGPGFQPPAAAPAGDQRTATDIGRLTDQQVEAITPEQMRAMPLEALQAIVDRQNAAARRRLAR